MRLKTRSHRLDTVVIHRKRCSSSNDVEWRPRRRSPMRRTRNRHIENHAYGAADLNKHFPPRVRSQRIIGRVGRNRPGTLPFVSNGSVVFNVVLDCFFVRNDYRVGRVSAYVFIMFVSLRPREKTGISHPKTNVVPMSFDTRTKPFGVRFDSIIYPITSSILRAEPDRTVLQTFQSGGGDRSWFRLETILDASKTRVPD